MSNIFKAFFFFAIQIKLSSISRDLGMGWMDGSYGHFNSISVISGRWKGDDEKLGDMETNYPLKGFHPTDTQTLLPA